MTIVNSTINNVYGGVNEAKMIENTYVKISSSIIQNSAYAGGKGATATVMGDSTIIIDGATEIKENVFGGGNAAMTGTEESPSNCKVYIYGGTIGKDVYGGANTSVVYGNTYVVIGKENKKIPNVILNNINILGTVFGGGKSNTAGSENYDFSFISVTENSYIDVDALNYQEDYELNIAKSIFGSGNAAKIEGDGYINISNYGTNEKPKKLISIQRATDVRLNNTSLWISGTTDTTNEFSKILYTINRVKNMILQNNSCLYLANGVNLLEKLTSLDENSNLEEIQINDNEITKNTDNRIYILQGKNIPLIKETGDYGEIEGIIFLGKYNGTDTIETSIYSKEYEQGETVKEEDINYFYKNSYALTAYDDSLDTKKNGFYTNNINDKNNISIEYIQPEEQGQAYQWLIGEITDTLIYEDIELIASKYSSTAQTTLDLTGLESKNTSIEVESIDTIDLNENVILKNGDDIPNIAEESTKANYEFALVMESTLQGWQTSGKTTYLYNKHENKEASISGSDKYYTDLSNIVPSFTFNLMHSKNITENINLGDITIRMRAEYKNPNNELIIKNIVIILTLSDMVVESNIDYYEGAITPGEKYTTFINSTPASVSQNSSISLYYSVYLDNYDNSKYYDKFQGYYHRLFSNAVLPKGTKIRFIDSIQNNQYYYYIVTDEDEANEKKTYDFTEFKKMGTIDEYYSVESTEYYNEDRNYVLEEFIFQIDFSDAEMSEDIISKNITIQLIDKYDSTVKLTVNDDIYQMIYSVYKDKNAKAIINLTPSVVDMYELKNIDLKVKTTYTYQYENSSIIYDTSNIGNCEGLKLTFYKGTERLSKEDIKEISVTYNGNEYFAREDGTILFKVAENISNIEAKLSINLSQKADWENGIYSIVIEEKGLTKTGYEKTTITNESLILRFIENRYGLKVDLDNNSKLIDKISGKTQNDDNMLDFLIQYESGFLNPTIRVALARRDYSNVYSTNYVNVDLADYIKNLEVLGNKNKNNEYLLIENPLEEQHLILNLKENLTAGSYKVKFLLYDGENYIGEVYQMIIIK